MSTDKIEIGHRSNEGWVIDQQANMQLKANKNYNLKVALNGTTVTLVVDGQQSVSASYAPRIIDDFSFGLNNGLVGVGVENSSTRFDNVTVQQLPPEITHEVNLDFTNPSSEALVAQSGNWALSNGQFVGMGNALDETALATTSLAVAPLSVLELESTLAVESSGGLLFDIYATDEFKFVGLDSVTNQVSIGHFTERTGWVVDSFVSLPVDSLAPYALKVTLVGSTVSVSVDDQVVAGHVFNSILNDGDVGAFADQAQVVLDTFILRTDDPAYEDEGGELLMAAFAPSNPVSDTNFLLTDASLPPVIEEAMNRWTHSGVVSDDQLQVLKNTNYEIADLSGLTLGLTVDHTIFLDTTAAGYGWFIDATPEQNEEFHTATHDGLIALSGTEAYGHMDLLTVVMHEMGHVVGFEDVANGDATQLMDPTLSAGIRYLVAESETTNSQGEAQNESSRPSSSLSKMFNSRAILEFLFPDRPTVSRVSHSNQEVEHSSVAIDLNVMSDSTDKHSLQEEVPSDLKFVRYH